MSSGVRRRFRTQVWAWIWVLLFGNWGLSGTAQSWCEKEERKFLEGKCREEVLGWGLMATGTWRDVFLVCQGRAELSWWE